MIPDRAPLVREHADTPRLIALLSPRGEWPTDRGAAEQADELPASRGGSPEFEDGLRLRAAFVRDQGSSGGSR
jgi:hypothetical protein